MALSAEAVKRLMIAAGDADLGNEIGSAIDSGSAHSDQAAAHIAAFIVATSVSPTTDFAALKVADKVVQIKAVAGNAVFTTVATAGTLPVAAVVGDLYIVIRGFAAPVKRTSKF
jgi:hypothetical protein